MFIGLLVAPVAGNSTVCLVCLFPSELDREADLIGRLFADLSFRAGATEWAKITREQGQILM